MKLITAFFMAWGNYLTIPCPYKRWENDLKNSMLAFLPSVGAVVGGLWVLLIRVLRLAESTPGLPVHVPEQFCTIVCVYFLFACCGFMHMDGFMDCTDAIMSRRPLEVRQRILKDSNVGAFAVVMVVFLLLAWYAVMSSVFGKGALAALFLIPVTSRFVSGQAVMLYRPIGHSQYKEDYDKPKARLRAAAIVQAAVYLAAAGLLAGEETMVLAAVAAAFLVTAIATHIAGWYARRQLGGMSGDVAGYMICWGELAGIAAVSVVC